MSASETSALVEQYIAAFNEGDHDTMLSLVSEDVIHDLRDGRREIGREKLRWHLAEVARHFRERWSDVLILTGEEGRRAAAEITARGTYAETLDGFPAANGGSYSLPAGMFFEIDGGSIARVTFYCNRTQWLSAMNAG